MNMQHADHSGLQRAVNERLSIENEVRLAEKLTDADRIRIFRDLLRTVDAIQMTKSLEELNREEEVRLRLDIAPARERYAELIERLT